MIFRRTSKILRTAQLAGDLGEDRLGHMAGSKITNGMEWEAINQHPGVNAFQPTPGGGIGGPCA